MGTHYGPTFTTGDVVGAGLHTETNDIFFTKNGEWLGVAFRNVCVAPLYPTVGLHSKDERVSMNYGSAPFAFDFDTYVSEENLRRIVAVAGEDMPTSVTHELVRDYLNYHGYSKTLRALEDVAAARAATSAAPSICNPEGRRFEYEEDEQEKDNEVNDDTGKNHHFMEGDVSSAEFSYSFDLRQRACIHSLILAGNMDAAEEHLRVKYPGVFESQYADEVRLHLACQRFVEIIRGGNLANAVEYAQNSMPSCVGMDRSWDEAILNVVALVAYDSPRRSSCQSLLFLTPLHRDRVADAVNSAILAAAHVGKRPSEAGAQVKRSTVADEEEEGRLTNLELLTGAVSASSDLSAEGVKRRGLFSSDIPAIGTPTTAAVLGLGCRAEVLLRQLFISAQELRAANGGKDEVFKLVCSPSGSL